jgi:hypothetical protein
MICPPDRERVNFAVERRARRLVQRKYRGSVSQSAAPPREVIDNPARLQQSKDEELIARSVIEISKLLVLKPVCSRGRSRRELRTRCHSARMKCEAAGAFQRSEHSATTLRAAKWKRRSSVSASGNRSLL